MGDMTLYEPGVGVTVINESDIDNNSVYGALVGQHPEVAALIRWTTMTKGDVGLSRQGGLFSRDRYVTPDRIFDQFDVARDAASSDDVVSGVLESTEALAFGRTSFACEDEDLEDIWDQIGLDLDLDSRIREMWRELFITSQFYGCVWWGTKTYKVRGTTPAGVARKKTFADLTVPVGITLLDAKKVVPIGNLMFGQEQLAYIADRTEVDMLDAAVLNDPEADAVSRQIIVAKYEPPDYERRNLAKQGINAEWLYILNPRNVWRHTLTRPQFQRWADVRMKSVFELLDLKNQLRQMDRANLIGSSNYILLVRKGTDHLPAKPDEIAHLQNQVTTVARVPVLVGDHRLSVEIVTPKNDFTLSTEKHGVIDQRLSTRLYQMFMVHGGTGSARSDDSQKLMKIIARGLESRRFMLRRSLERVLIDPAVEANDAMSTSPKLRFFPQRIEMDFDSAMAQILMDMRDRGDLSRDSWLSLLDFDQADEARMREREKRDYDDVFVPTNVPFSAPGAGHNVPVGPGGKPNTLPAGDQPTPPHSHAPDGTPVPLPSNSGGTGADVKANPKSAGRRGGGISNGGGAAKPGSGQGQAPRRGRPKD